jgi:hypothetical protein
LNMTTSCCGPYQRSTILMVTPDIFFVAKCGDK